MSVLFRVPGFGQVYAGVDAHGAALDAWRCRGELFVRLGRLLLIFTPRRVTAYLDALHVQRVRERVAELAAGH